MVQTRAANASKHPGYVITGDPLEKEKKACENQEKKDAKEAEKVRKESNIQKAAELEQRLSLEAKEKQEVVFKPPSRVVKPRSRGMSSPTLLCHASCALCMSLQFVHVSYTCSSASIHAKGKESIAISPSAANSDVGADTNATSLQLDSEAFSTKRFKPLSMRKKIKAAWERASTDLTAGSLAPESLSGALSQEPSGAASRLQELEGREHRQRPNSERCGHKRCNASV